MPEKPCSSLPPTTSTKELTSGHNLSEITKKTAAFPHFVPSPVISSQPFSLLFPQPAELQSPSARVSGTGLAVLWLWAILTGYKLWLRCIPLRIVVCSDPLKEGLEVKSEKRMGLEEVC